MADSKIDILGLGDVPLVTELYNQIFQPRRDTEQFERRLAGRNHPLVLVASVQNEPVGFFLGFELKPDTYLEYLYGVLADYRGQGIASRLMNAANDWAREKGYRVSRLEVQNPHRAMLHLAIANAYDIVGMRWDSDQHANLVLFEKPLAADQETY